MIKIEIIVYFISVFCLFSYLIILYGNNTKKPPISSLMAYDMEKAHALPEVFIRYDDTG